MAHEHYNVLRLEGPPGNGVNVGKAVDKWGEYSWEGEVVNNKANGFGRKTILSGKCLCHIAYGEFKDGEPWGSCVGKDPEGQTIIFLYENGQYRGNDYYDSSNDCHKSTFENAQKQSAAARSLVILPWSPKTNHFLKWKSKQDLILTVLLVGERLHRIKYKDVPQNSLSLSLCSLPVEMWEIILQFLFAVKGTVYQLLDV
eukprot:m.195912 g.195912  ORF g.195912 m.195912 type:complete len:200 (+) comp15693_c1_seq7:756-1355(+)